MVPRRQAPSSGNKRVVTPHSTSLALGPSWPMKVPSGKTEKTIREREKERERKRGKERKREREKERERKKERESDEKKGRE